MSANEKHKTDIGGFWRIENRPISHVGVVPYLGKSLNTQKDAEGNQTFHLPPNKVYWVFRPPEELFAPEAIASFNGKPFIDEHTMLGKNFTSVEELPAEGTISNVRQSLDRPGFLIADFDIWTEKMQKKIEGGKKQLSLGYFCVYKEQKGVYNGQAYDFIQTKLRGNHIALVERGRMGSVCCVCDNALTIDLIEGIHDNMENNKDDAKKDVKPEDALAECLSGADDELCQKILDFIAKEKSAKGGDSASSDATATATAATDGGKKEGCDGAGCPDKGGDAAVATDGGTPPPPPPKESDKGNDGDAKKDGDGDAQKGDDGNADANADANKGDDGDKGDDGNADANANADNGGDDGNANADGDGDGKGDNAQATDGCNGGNCASAQDGAATQTNASVPAPKQNLEAKGDGKGDDDDNDKGDKGDDGNADANADANNADNGGKGDDDGKGGDDGAQKPAETNDCGTATDRGNKGNGCGKGNDCGNAIAKDTFIEISKAIHRRDLLAKAVGEIVGVFDASEMTEKEVAEYAVSHLGIACDSGEELAAVRGYMACAAKQSKMKPAFTTDHDDTQRVTAAKSKGDLMKQYLG